MADENKATTYVLISPKKSSKCGPKSRSNKCVCSAPYRAEQLTMNFRLMAVALCILFGMCLLLFIWNVVLWRQMEDLQDHVITLTGRLERKTSSHRHVKPWLSQKRREKAIRTQNWQDWADSIDAEGEQGNAVELKRIKRSAPEDMVPVEANLPGSHPSPAYLSRVKREKKRKGGKKRRNGGQTGRKKRPRPAAVPKATAIHAQITGSPPYQGMVTDVGGVLNKWTTRLNEGFNTTLMNIPNEKAKIKVIKPGVYFLYSQVTFRMSRDIEVHQRVMIGFDGETQLASCANTMPTNGGSQDYITCHSYGIAKFSSDESFRISIYPHGLEIYNNPAYTYFGAFLIGV